MFTTVELSLFQPWPFEQDECISMAATMTGIRLGE